MNEKYKVPRREWLTELYLWACERLYHEFAWLYDVVSWGVSAGHWRRWQGTVWRYVRGTRILELGCGTGAILVEGVRKGFSMYGVDRSPEMLAIALDLLKMQQLEVSLVQGDGHRLPIDNGSFDSVVATFPAGYIFDQNTLLEIRRLLTPYGRLVIAGVWVKAQSGLERFVPVFYGRPGEDVITAMVEQVENAGFDACWHEVPEGRFAVGVLVAQKRDSE